MLVNMSATEWSELGVGGLPTGTVTLLLADVEGSTRLWESQPDEMSGAIARLDATLAELVARYDGVRPVEQGEGDSFVLAFARASDAVGCALALQRAPLAPLRLRIGVNTGEVQLRDEGNYVGPTINRTARIRDLGHGGQTLLSGATEAMVLDHLPEGAWLTELGTHPLRDLPRSERVVQLCHPDVHNDFPPLRTEVDVVARNLPTRLTSFVGRTGQIADVRELLAVNRLVTLTGAGGVGMTRLAVEVAASCTCEFAGGTRYVDLAPITDPALVPVAVARAMGLPDQPGRSTMETIIRSISQQRMLIVLDNCEHLLAAGAELVTALTDACAGVALLTTSREPIGVAGESTWRVPSLSIEDEAADLFVDRARLVKPDFRLTTENLAVVREICQRLDGIPLAIELAAARVRALSLPEINDSLHDRFRLLTGGSRTAVRRQQTLRASVDWSHALLSESERVLFRRLAVFAGGFDLSAAQTVAGSDDLEHYLILDQLTLLVDKSLVVAESAEGRTRYRLLETVRQYAAEKLGESAEAMETRDRHRDYYTKLAAGLDSPAQGQHERLLTQAELDVDNFRVAFAWSRENGDTEAAMQLASALLPIWLARGRIAEGWAWFDTMLAENDAHGNDDVAPAVLARALADKALLEGWGIMSDRLDQAQRALSIARDVGDPALVARALSACGSIAAYEAELGQGFLDEATSIARELGDQWRLSQILGWQSYAGFFGGNPRACHAAGLEGRELADSIGDHFNSRFCRNWGIAAPLCQRGDIVEAINVCRQLLDESIAASDTLSQFLALQSLCVFNSYKGEIASATGYAESLGELGAEFGGFLGGCGHMIPGLMHLAAGDVVAAEERFRQGWPLVSAHQTACGIFKPWRGEAALAAGDLDTARHWADDAVAVTSGYQRAVALATRSRIALAQREVEQAERDALDSLAIAADFDATLLVPELLECLAAVGVLTGKHAEAARLHGAADSVWHGIGAVRFKVHQARYDDSVATLRAAIREVDFDRAWAEGAALSVEEATAYAQRGRGHRKRPSSGWDSLTPTEREVVGLVREGLGNREIAARLFISHRTVQTHLTHVYTKLAITSRVQLAQEASKRS